MDRTEHIASLLYKHLQGTLNPEEQATLQAWLDEDPSHQALLAKNSDATELAHALKAWYQIPRTGLQEDQTLLEHMQQSKRRIALYRFIAIAATIVVALATGLYFYRHGSTTQDITPGYNQAILTFADGTKVELDSAQSGIIVQDESIKYSNGNPVKNVMLSGEGGKEGEGAETSLPNSLTLSTPKGGQYQIILSDGTKIWLNAASTLKYPSRFSGDRREVHLEGEAYFEIKEDKTKSFKVVSKNQAVDVLGTSFNVNSYESTVKTTLVTGVVQVAVARHAERSQTIIKEGDGIQLKPGEQSISTGIQINKAKVNLTKELAWRNNKFSFDGKSFKQVMDELARWYNLDIIYPNGIPKQTFFGSAYRDSNLSIVLALLEGAHIHYRLQGHQLIITQQP